MTPLSLMAGLLCLSASAAELPSISLKELREGPAPAARGVPAPPKIDLNINIRHTTISNAAAAMAPKEDYQLGDEWGKIPVTSLAGENAVFSRAARATAFVGGATGFYLGKFNGKHMMATNHHVFHGRPCGWMSAKFNWLGKTFECEKVYGDWTQIDLVLFSITVPTDDEPLLAGVGGNFAFDAPVYPGQELLTIGFGVADNPSRAMVANRDSDCKTFSGAGEFRLMADPDDYNPGPDKVWSFASACDVSHGDSGSAFVDRRTGAVVGIVWTGRIPKSPSVKSSRALDDILRRNAPQIWTELTYTVPAAKIRDVVAASLAAADPETKSTLSALLLTPVK
jgi:hypothetical protein